MTKKAAAQDLIDRVRALRLAGDVEAAEALRADAVAAVKACAPRDKKAMSEALEAAYAEAPPSKDVAVSSYHDVAGVDDVVNQGVAQVRAAVNEGLKAADMARSIAETLLTARLKMTNKHGLPDVTAASKYTKNIAHDMLTLAAADVAEDDVDRLRAHQSLAKAVRNRMSDVVVAYLRSLDEAPEKFPAMELAKAQSPGQRPMEAVYALYASVGIELPRKGRTELAREDARRRAELVRAAVRGELPEEDEPSGVDLAAVDKFERSLTRFAQRAEKLSGKERAEAKARLNAVIASLAAEAAKL